VLKQAISTLESLMVQINTCVALDDSVSTELVQQAAASVVPPIGVDSHGNDPATRRMKLMGQLQQAKLKMKSVLAIEDYEGASVVKQYVKDLDEKLKDLDATIPVLTESPVPPKERSKQQVDLQEQLQRMRAQETVNVAAKDYIGAAATQKEIKSLEQRLIAVSAPEPNALRSLINDEELQEAQCRNFRRILEELRGEREVQAAKKEYDAAAAVHQKVLLVEQQLMTAETAFKSSAPASSAVEVAGFRKCEQHRTELQDQLQRLRSQEEVSASANDYDAAAAAQKEIMTLEQQLASVSAPEPSALRAMKNDYLLKEAQQKTGGLPNEINLRSLAVLSLSPTSRIPESTKGNGKNKDKMKGNPKGKQKGYTKNSGVNRVMYVGHEGYIACITANDEAGLELLKELVPGTQIDLENVKTRPGKLTVFEVTVKSRCVKRLQLQDTAARYVFPYYVAEVSDTFATMDYARSMLTNNFVDVVMQCTSVDQRTKQDGNEEPFLVMTGNDCNGVEVGPLRLWRFDETQASQGCLYIVRGLKVVPAQRWSEQAWKYVSCFETPKALECTYKTTLEDVTHVSAIASCFN
jgi:protein-arginine kinase activator protein McsA